MNNKLLLLFIVLLTTGSVFAQKRGMKTSNKDYKKLAYIDAQKMYLNIAEKGYADMELFQNLADTYYYNNDYTNANKWYAKVFEYDTPDISKEYFFKYIQTLKSVKDYATADKIVEEYLKVKGEDQFIKNYTNNRDYMDQIDLQSGRFEVKRLEMNSKAQDFGVGLYEGGKKAVFASSSDSSSMVKYVHKWSDREFLNLYTADVDANTGEFSNMEKFGNKNINTKFHESNAVFTKDNKTVYFTRNNFFKKRFKTSSDDINKLKIFRATREGEGDEWGNVEELSINGEDFSTAHPALSPNEDRLYFASDRPGGKKGLFDSKASSDIWYVALNGDGGLGTPVNVKEVNTPGNELFPFMSSNGDLYFSSNGHQGLGGLDVFVSQATNGELTKDVINLGKPVNGTQDDFAFVLNQEKQNGYFSSNRLSGKGLDDIYYFKQTKPLESPICKVDLAGVVTDDKTGALMPFATVVLLDSENNEIDKIVVGQDAAYNFELDCSSNYSIKAVKDGYSVAEAFVQTPDTSTSLKQPLAVEKSIEEKVDDINVGDDLNDILDLSMIYFDFDKSYIRPDAEIELQKVLLFMNTYPTSEVDIRSHTDSRAPDAYNIKLSDRRAKSTRAYLIMKGISPNRLTAAGYGEYQLVNECSNGVECTEEQHQLNRRSEFILTKK